MRVLATDAEPVESGGGEDHGVDVAELPQPRGDVAAEVGHLHTRMGCQEGSDRLTFSGQEAGCASRDSGAMQQFDKTRRNDG